jgi:hypothetical protein
MTAGGKPQISFWKSLSALDWIALAALFLGLVAGISGTTGQPGIGLLRFLGLIAVFYLLFRFWTRWRDQLLWSLRNRLFVAYLFMGI